MNANALPYKDTIAAKGSKLHETLTTANPLVRDALAARIYKETTAAHAATYPKETREYFATWQERS